MNRTATYRVSVFATALIGILLVGASHIPAKQFVHTHETQTDWKRAPHVEGELLVRFHPNATPEQINAAHNGLDARVLHNFEIVEGLVHVKLPDRVSVQEAMGHYVNTGAVMYAEPNGIHETLATPDDPRFDQLWGLHNTGQSGGVVDADINAPEAWEMTTGDANVVIGVIDTGVFTTHADLQANMWVNSLEIADNGVDDDNNGYVDDVHGINARNDSGNLSDSNGHGTHCSGTIAGRGNNGVGVAGVNWRAKIVGCDFLGGGSGDTADGIKCLEYMYELKTREEDPVPIVATNNSWGGGGFEQSLRDAIARHGEADILFVAAAGNNGANNDNGGHYPSNYQLPNVIAVASSTRSDNLSGFSNYGKSTVHVAAPGSSIVSTVPSGYASFSGTSMAAPHVSGLAGLIAAQDRTRSVPQIKNLLMLGGQPIGATANTTISGNRLRAADDGGRGSLSCSGQLLTEQLAPRRERTLVFRPDGVSLAALNVDCDKGAGDIEITVSPGDAPIMLLDDGLNGDQLAGDGVYSQDYVAAQPGVFDFTFPTGEVRTAEMFDETYRGPIDATYQWRTITGTALNMGDDTVRSISVPFTWMFNNGHPGNVSDILVSSNGQISVTDDNSSAANPHLPTSNMDTVVAAMWDDLDPNKGGDVFHEVLGSAPNRELIIEWRDVRHFDCGTGTVGFQIVVQEASSDILINYRDVEFGDAECDAGATATVGVQVSNKRAALGSYLTDSLADGVAWKFTINRMPTVEAGDDIIALPGESVSLAGVVTDPDGDETIMDLGWTQLDGEEVNLSDASALNPTLTTPSDSGHLVFELAATDDGGVTLEDQMRVTVDHPPIADAGIDRVVPPHTQAQLDGTGSSDQDGTIVSYSWVASGVPVEIHDADTATPMVHAMGGGIATIELTVTDDLGVSATDSMTLHVTQDDGKGCKCAMSPSRNSKTAAMALIFIGVFGLVTVVRRRRGAL